MIGPDVTELLPALTLAQQWDLTADEVARNVFAHPTLSEAVKEAVHGHRRPHDQLLLDVAGGSGARATVRPRRHHRGRPRRLRGSARRRPARRRGHGRRHRRRGRLGRAHRLRAEQDPDRDRRADDRDRRRPPSSAWTSATTRATPPPRSASTWPGSTSGSSSSRPTSPTTSRRRLERDGVTRRPRAAAASTVPTGSSSTLADGAEQTLEADAVLVATGAAPAHAADGAARRRADPHLGAGLRPHRACRPS